MQSELFHSQLSVLKGRQLDVLVMPALKRLGQEDNELAGIEAILGHTQHLWGRRQRGVNKAVKSVR